MVDHLCHFHITTEGLLLHPFILQLIIGLGMLLLCIGTACVCVCGGVHGRVKCYTRGWQRRFMNDCDISFIFFSGISLGGTVGIRSRGVLVTTLSATSLA